MTMQLFTGMDYLRIDIANHFGLDKELWEDRIEWVHTHENQLEELVSKAETPALFHAAVGAYRKAQKGQPSGYPISLDATASGPQLLSVFSNCEKSARLCNVVDTGRREDFYRNIYGSMLQRTPVQGTAQGARLDHKTTKNAVMTAMFGSTREPRDAFGEGILLQVFYDTLNDEAPGAWALTQAMLSLWDSRKQTYSWVLPDNFHVHDRVETERTDTVEFLGSHHQVKVKLHGPKEDGKSLPANNTHSVDGMVVREMGRRCSHDPHRIREVVEATKGHGTSTSRPRDQKVIELWNHYLGSGFLSARILDYLDSRNVGHVDAGRILKLIKSLPARPFHILANHDCFRVLPNYGNDLRIQYNTILAELAESNILQYLLRQSTGRQRLRINKMGNLAPLIREANYALS